MLEENKMENEILPCRTCTCSECKNAEFFYQHFIKSRSFIVALSELLEYDLIDESKALVAARYDSYFGGDSEPNGGALGGLVIQRFDNSYHPEIELLTIGSILKSVPCRICGGYQGSKDRNCYGMTRQDGWIVCTRIESKWAAHGGGWAHPPDKAWTGSVDVKNK